MNIITMQTGGVGERARPRGSERFINQQLLEGRWYPSIAAVLAIHKEWACAESFERPNWFFPF
jgi:hypothetical protein